MNKKTTCLLCLSAGLLLGAGVAVPSTLLSARVSGDAPVAVANKSITVMGKDGVTLTVPTEAAPGSVVDANVELDTTKVLEVTDLYVNGLKASKVSSTHFRFVMPDEEVLLTLDAIDAIPANAFAINVDLPDGMFLDGIPEYALPEEEVEFTVTFAAYSGLTWDGTLKVVTHDGETPMEVETNIEGDHVSFTMPENEVYISTEGVEARNYLVKKSYASYGTSDALEVFGNIEVVGEEGNKTLIASSIYATSGRTATGSKLRVNLVKSSILVPLGIHINELDKDIYLEDGATYVEFDMPGRNITIEPIVETRHYEVKATFVGDDNNSLSAALYHKVEDEETGEVAYVEDDGTGVVYSEKAYLKVESNDPAVGAGATLLKYTKADGTIQSNKVFVNDEGYYEVSIGYGVVSAEFEIKAGHALANTAVSFDYSAEDNHLTGVVYVQDGKQLVAVDEDHPIIPGASVFIDAYSDDEGFGLKSVSVDCTKADENVDSENAVKVRTGAFKGFFRYDVSEQAASIVFTLTQQKVFNSYGIVGEYTTKYLGLTGSTLLGENTYMNVLNPAGTFAANYSYGYAITEMIPAAPEANYGYFMAVQGSNASGIAPETTDSFNMSGSQYLFGYSDKMVFWPGNVPLSASSSDKPLVARKDTVYTAFHLDPTQDEELSISAAKFNDGDNLIGVVYAGYGADYYAGLVYNYTTGDFYFGDSLEIELTAGDSLSATDALFNIVVDDEVIYTVGTKNGNKVLLDGLQGEFTVLDGDGFYLDGLGNAYMGDKVGTYSGTADSLTLIFKEYDEDGLTITTVLASLDFTSYAAEILDVNVNGPVGHEIVEQSENIVVNGRNARYGFTKGEDGSYTSNNGGISSSTAEMSFYAYKSTVLSFDYFASGETNWDYMTIYLNGEVLEGYEKVGSNDGVSGSVRMPLEAGDVLSVIYTKDSGSDKGEDKVVLSNVVFATGATAGEYAIEGDDTPIILDGYGEGSYGDKEISYDVPQNEEEGTIVITYTDKIEGEGSITIVTTTFTLDIASRTGTKSVEQNTIATANPVVAFSETNPFVYDAEAGTYTSGNKGIGSSQSSVEFTLEQDGTFSFDYHAEGEGQYDYARIYVNGELYADVKGTGTTAYTLESHLEFEVQAGDKIKVVFQKDSSGDKGADCIVLSNVLYYVNN